MSGFVDARSTVPGVFTRPTRIQIQRRKAERIARLFDIPDVHELHVCLQHWADIYLDNNDRIRVASMKERKREAEKCLPAIRKAVGILRDKDSYIANTLRTRISHDLQIRSICALQSHSGDTCAISMEFEDYLDALDTAARELDSSLSFERPVALPGLPRNPGLKINLSNIERYWLCHSRARGSDAYKAYWNESTGSPGNDATRFTCLVFRTIDRTLSRASIYSQMKRYTLGGGKSSNGS